MEIKGYKLIEPPFKGGMAVVYKGQKSVFTRAFKFVRPDKAEHSTKLCSQFLQEIEIQSKLDHPNIVKILDAFPYEDAAGKSFTVLEMEWLNGMDLQRYIDSNGKKGLSEKEIEKIIMQVADGMKYAHSKHILHLDLKPSNLFMTESGYIKIIDFGIAKVVGDNAQIIEGAEKVTLMTETGESSFRGTLAFASPEQQVGGKLGFYSDIYSFGKTLQFLCTGTTDPSAEVKSEKFSAIIDKCTAQNPKKRYQNFDELINAMKQGVVIKDEPKVLELYKWHCTSCNKTFTDPVRDDKTHLCIYCGKQTIEKIS